MSIIIDVKKYKWLLEANKIGVITGKFPHSYDDELNDMIYDYSIQYDINDFFRTSIC